MYEVDWVISIPDNGSRAPIAAFFGHQSAEISLTWPKNKKILFIPTRWMFSANFMEFE